MKLGHGPPPEAQAFSRSVLIRHCLLSFSLEDRDLLKLISSAFPSGTFEAATLSWTARQVTLDALSKSHTLTGILTIPSESLGDYDYRSDGQLCLFTDHLSRVLDFALLGRHGDSPINTIWRCEAQRLRIKVEVQGTCTADRTLRHVPDALLPRRRLPDFSEASYLRQVSPLLLRNVCDALPESELIRVRASRERVEFIHPTSVDDRFEPARVVPTSDAQATYSRPLLDHASKIVDRAPPREVEIAIRAEGFMRVSYQYPKALLIYLIPAIVELP